jgi:hypothetical protein
MKSSSSTTSLSSVSNTEIEKLRSVVMEHANHYHTTTKPRKHPQPPTIPQPH